MVRYKVNQLVIIKDIDYCPPKRLESTSLKEGYNGRLQVGEPFIIKDIDCEGSIYSYIGRRVFFSGENYDNEIILYTREIRKATKKEEIEIRKRYMLEEL